MSGRNARAVHVRDVEYDLRPGAFEFFITTKSAEPQGMIYRCPCGCGEERALKFDSIPREAGDDQRWHWDGDRARPPLTPSINHTTGCRWHGRLTAGEFKEC